jgi:glycosyltransferase involved in cell wall biosynthesis
MPDISVIIPSFNHIEHLQRCVSSILNQQCSGTFEIIIVDSSPSDVQNKIELMFKTNDLIHLIKLPNQTFPGIARNIGIKQAKGKYIGMIDADCSAEGGWLECITKYVKENTVICGTIKNGTPYSTWGTLSYLVEFNQFLESTQPPVEIEGASTGNFGCEKILFEKYGYFSDYRAFEDFFFASNLKKQGGKILKVSGFTITHHNRTTFNQIWKNINMLGLLSAKVRRENNLPPKLIFRFPALAFLLTFYRYFSGLKNTLHNKYFFSYILLSPLLIILFLGWSTGFYEGSKEEGKI